MLENITPGQKVQVTVAKQPTNQAAKKTLARLLAKDPQVAAELQRRSEVRQSKKHVRTRAGRPWFVRPVKKPAVVGDQGESGTFVARYQELKDLKSVQRFIEVKPA
jgi:NAD-dependent oxidoreductase involved in siderophore biosynthesis